MRAGPLSYLCAAVVAALLAFAVPATANAQTAKLAPPDTSSTLGGTATGATPTPSGLPDTPDGYEVDAAAALSAADQDPKIQDRRESIGPDGYLTASLEAKAVNVWEVSYYVDGSKENLVVVDGESGDVTESWTGSAVTWPMARGHEGQFGHLLNAPWVWGPLAGIFLLCLFDFGRWRKWVHLDLLVLLSFGISQAFFNAAEIGVSVPLYYPPLVYLLLRLIWIGFRGAGRAGTASEGLRPTAPRWLLIGVAIGLIAVRIAGNVGDSGVIDVGYAGVIGADKITDAKPIYGEGSFPDNNQTGDTYGPANYFAYVPFEQVFPWSGAWDDLPAAHAAAITFDLATLLGLYALGMSVTRRRRDGAPDGAIGIGAEAGTQGYPEPDPQPGSEMDLGAGAGTNGTGTHGYPSGNGHTPRPARRFARLRAWAAPYSPGRRENTLGLVLAFAWLAYPYSDFALQSNSNDALISALLVWSLALFGVPLARGALLGTAGMAKFAPVPLFPLFFAGERGLSLRRPQGAAGDTAGSWWRNWRGPALCLAGFVGATALFLLHPAIDPGLSVFYDRTIKSQVDRVSPFSIWGQADLEWLHTLVKLFAVGLAVAVAFVPRTRSLTQVAALAGAVVIAVQLTLEHWFYLYIPWFLPMMLLAMAVTAAAPTQGEQLELEPERESVAPPEPAAV